MADGRCETCRWWDAADHRDRRLVNDLALRDPWTHEPVDPQPFELRRCSSPKLREYERPEIDGAATMDGSEYWSTLVTGPQFGCIHHQEKT